MDTPITPQADAAIDQVQAMVRTSAPGVRLTVHTIRPVKALQRANARWHSRPINHLQLVRIVPARRTLGDRIIRLSNRLENSPITWALITTSAAILYIAVIVTHLAPA